MEKRRMERILRGFKDTTLTTDNDRRKYRWYSRWVRLLKTGMPDEVALMVWKMIDDSNGFRYNWISTSALESLRLAMEDRNKGRFDVNGKY